MQRPLFLVLVLTLACAASALAAPLDKDAPGSKDIPGIPRYEGSVIFGYKLDKFDEAEMPLGKWVNSQSGYEKSLKLEGRRTRILYLAPPDRSSLEVIRNYVNALQKLGYQTLYECSGFEQCGQYAQNLYFNTATRNKIMGSQPLEYAYSMSVEDPRIHVAKLDQGGRQSHVFLFAARQENASQAEAGKRVAVFVEEVLSGEMEDRMVTLKADDLGKSLGEQGRVAIYGILFDFDKAEIKPESRPQLEEMAKLMKARSGLKVFIVGHTDNQGKLEYNAALSQRRAEAVAAALARDFGVASSRMTAKGLANFAPVASNATEEGRARNRRVEMVEQ